MLKYPLFFSLQALSGSASLIYHRLHGGVHTHKSRKKNEELLPFGLRQTGSFKRIMSIHYDLYVTSVAVKIIDFAFFGSMFWPNPARFWHVDSGIFSHNQTSNRPCVVTSIWARQRPGSVSASRLVFLSQFW